MDSLMVVRRRLAAQRLTGEGHATPAEAVAWSGAVQAQEYAEAQWSIGQRVRACDEGRVEEACARGAILRTHVMRPTWHFVAAEDLRWLLRLTAGRVHARNAGRYRELGLGPGVLAGGDEVLARTVQDRDPRTRPELGAALRAAGIDTDGQRLAHLVMHAELEGLLCSGPRRGKQHTYVPLDGRAPAAPDRPREADVAELVLRFYRSHGPATLGDFAWWSGLTVADARAGVAAAGDRLTVDGSWICTPGGGTIPPPRRAMLVPTFDETLVAYRSMRTVLAGEPPAGAELRRPIVLGGRTVGSWLRRLSRREVAVEATLFTALGAGQARALRAAADRYGAFLALAARLSVRPARSPPSA